MDNSLLKEKLQQELENLLKKNSDIFNPILGIESLYGDFNWAGAAGVANSDKLRPMEVKTPFFIASITKMYTAASVLILDQRGDLSLDDPLAMYLPGSILSGLHIYHGTDYSDQLTINHLISQTSGLPDYFLGKPREGHSVFERLISEGDFGWDIEQVVDITKNSLDPKFPPQPAGKHRSGKKAFYSDTNYQLLGAVLEAVTDKHLSEIYFELITDPLDLPDTYLYGYGRDQNNQPADIFYKTSHFHLDKAMKSFGPDGGLVSTVADSLKFLRAYLSGYLFDNPAALERIMDWNRIFFPFQYGLGLMRIKMPRIFSPFTASPELIGHSGATSAFLFHSDQGNILVTGTLNQVDNQSRPVRLMLKLANMVNNALS